MSSSADLARYSRQITLPEVGLDGQRRISAASVLVIGAGGLGSPAAFYLAAAGVGRIGIVDNDQVELSNLHRQILHGTPDVGGAKTASAATTLARLNPGVRIDPIEMRLDASNADELIKGYDIVVDGSDNYATRYAVNDACARAGKPWVYGSVERFSGQAALFGANGGPCYRCLYPEAPAPGTTPSCEEIGVLGAVPGVIGSLQAVETLKWIVGIGSAAKMMQFDLLNGQIRVVGIDRDPECKACGARAGTAAPAAPAPSSAPSSVDPNEAVRMLEADSSAVLLDVREKWEWDVARVASSRLLPLSEIQGKVETLDKSRTHLVICHHGQRSGMVAEWLRSQGFRATNILGGIDRWSRDVDPSIARY